MLRLTTLSRWLLLPVAAEHTLLLGQLLSLILIILLRWLWPLGTTVVTLLQGLQWLLHPITRSPPLLLHHIDIEHFRGALKYRLIGVE
ncbi:MAG TPA: hypothetical protein VH187_13955 [Scandinavium sp.]|uniref:hypothetical protein n=1 Tax=Scandinavium sp. TaxID=2830653 RepID=UPI002E325A8E|nr:hypothetical protein [Scandinavium sp.]HEX4502237.1 hypothetical protein [Scandinavium sp.]